MNAGRLGLLFTLLVIRSAFGQPHAGNFEDYEIQGYITYTFTNAPGKTTRWADFSLSVSGAKSIITVVYFNGEYFVCGTDGLDSYLLNEMRPARARGTNVSQVGYISSGPFPFEALAPIQLTWIAYASFAHLADKNLALTMEYYKMMKQPVSTKIDRFPSAPALPQEIEWYYPGGYLAAKYVTGVTTNYFGATIPLTWSFITYRPGSPKNDPPVPGALGGTITNLSLRKYEGTFLPKLEGDFRLEDWRLEPEIGLAFNVPAVDGNWPQRDDPTLKNIHRIYREAAKVSKVARRRPRDSGGVLLVTIAIVALVLVGFAIAKLSRT
jgi:hypothetical protein